MIRERLRYTRPLAPQPYKNLEEERMRFAFIVSLLAVSLAAAAPAAAQSDINPAEKFHVEFATEWWQPTPELSIRTDALTAVGLADFDFADEFGIDASWFSEFRAVVKPARKHKVRVSYVPVRYEQTSPLRTVLSFNGTTFTGSPSPRPRSRRRWGRCSVPA